LVIPEPAETEMASVLEEVTRDYAVTEVAQVAFSDADTMFDAVTIFDAVTFAVLETIMVLAFIAVVQLAAVALRKPAMVSSVICVGGRRAVVNACGRTAISHTRSARATLGTKARARSAATAKACTTAKAWTTATTSMCSDASTTTAAHSATATAASAAVMALRVSAARKDERQGRCDYEFLHWLSSFICRLEITDNAEPSGAVS
jgi:hypothetical protein